MVLVVDIGNSDITLGGFQGENLSFVSHMSANTVRTSDEYAALIISLLALRGVERSEISGAIISSVVPPLNSVIKEALLLICEKEPLTVGPGIKTGISINCDIPSSVGSDIVCACVAVHKLYGSPALIIDMGATTNMIVLNGKGAFVGVSIIPGVQMGLDALSEGTAQLPKVSLSTPERVIEKNTADCMRSGIIFGNAAMTDGMIARINAELGTELPVYATGKMASYIIPHCTHKITVDEHLVLKGLNIIYQKNA